MQVVRDGLDICAPSIVEENKLRQSLQKLTGSVVAAEVESCCLYLRGDRLLWHSWTSGDPQSLQATVLPEAVSAAESLEAQQAVCDFLEQLAAASPLTTALQGVCEKRGISELNAQLQRWLQSEKCRRVMHRLVATLLHRLSWVCRSLFLPAIRFRRSSLAADPPLDARLDAFEAAGLELLQLVEATLLDLGRLERFMDHSRGSSHCELLLDGCEDESLWQMFSTEAVLHHLTIYNKSWIDAMRQTKAAQQKDGRLRSALPAQVDPKVSRLLLSLYQRVSLVDDCRAAFHQPSAIAPISVTRLLRTRGFRVLTNTSIYESTISISKQADGAQARQFRIGARVELCRDVLTVFAAPERPQDDGERQVSIYERISDSNIEQIYEEGGDFTKVLKLLYQYRLSSKDAGTSKLQIESDQASGRFCVVLAKIAADSPVTSKSLLHLELRVDDCRASAVADLKQLLYPGPQARANYELQWIRLWKNRLVLSTMDIVDGCDENLSRTISLLSVRGQAAVLESRWTAPLVRYFAAVPSAVFLAGRRHPFVLLVNLASLQYSVLAVLRDTLQSVAKSHSLSSNCSVEISEAFKRHRLVVLHYSPFFDGKPTVQISEMKVRL